MAPAGTGLSPQGARGAAKNNLKPKVIIYRGYIGIMDMKMEATMYYIGGLHRDNGTEHGNYYEP